MCFVWISKQIAITALTGHCEGSVTRWSWNLVILYYLDGIHECSEFFRLQNLISDFKVRPYIESEISGFTRLSAVTLGESCPRRRDTKWSHFQRSNVRWRKRWILTFEEQTTRLSRHVGYQLYSDPTPCPRREILNILQWKPWTTGCRVEYLNLNWSSTTK